MTINEGLAWLKTLKARHVELLGLRNSNANETTRNYYGRGDTNIPTETVRPLYDVKHLDRQIQGVAREIRLLDQAIKATNARTAIRDYTQNEAAFGELEAPALTPIVV